LDGGVVRLLCALHREIHIDTDVETRQEWAEIAKQMFYLQQRCEATLCYAQTKSCGSQKRHNYFLQADTRLCTFRPAQFQALFPNQNPTRIIKPWFSQEQWCCTMEQLLDL